MRRMESNRWLEFVSSKIRSQISFENARKAENWGVGLFSFLALGGALAAVGGKESGSLSLYASKILFLFLYHAVLALGIFLPAALQKGQKPLSKALGIRDFTSQFVIFLLLGFYSAVSLNIVWQAAVHMHDVTSSNFFGFVIWSNLLPAFFYAALAVWGFLGLAFWPSALAKFAEKSGKAVNAFLGVHLAFLFLTGLAYSEIAAFGSPNFFEHLHAAGLFWIFMAGSVFLAGRLLEPSYIQPLSALELEIAAGRLDRQDVILNRYKDLFISHRFDLWVRRVSNGASQIAHEIVAHCHEAVSLVSREKPSEIDLRLVEDRYRRAEAQYRKLEKQGSRFAFNFLIWNLSETEQLKAEALRDQFSKELRNAKIEIASVRKRIDERLLALKPVIQAIPTAPAVLPGKTEVVSEETTTSTTL